MIKKIKNTIALFIAVTTVGLAPVPVDAATCGNTKTQLIACDATTGVGTIGELIKITAFVMTILIGVVATGGLAYAAVLYASARDSQSQLDQSKTIIRNVVIGLLLYGFMIGLINWLVPGGVIG